MCCSPGVNSARHTSPSIRKFSFNPIGFEGPQTKQRLAGDSINDTGTFIRKKIGWISWALFQRIQTVITLADIERPRERGSAFAHQTVYATGRRRYHPAKAGSFRHQRHRSAVHPARGKSGDPGPAMAFPGGHIERQTRRCSMRQFAHREDQPRFAWAGKHIGTMDHQRATAWPTMVWCRLMYSGWSTDAFPNHEVAEVVWTPDPVQGRQSHGSV
jgi:hypothetical protein